MLELKVLPLPPRGPFRAIRLRDGRWVGLRSWSREFVVFDDRGRTLAVRPWRPRKDSEAGR